MKNMVNAGHKKVAVGALLASLLPGCMLEGGLYCFQHPEDESCQPAKNSGINVQNCGTNDLNTNVNTFTGRQWAIWVTKGDVFDQNAVWLPADPQMISAMTFASPDSPPPCGDNGSGDHVATFDFAKLGVVEGDQVTVRSIRLPTGLFDDPYQFHNCVDRDLVTESCNRRCDPFFDPGACFGQEAGNQRDNTDNVYTFSASAPFATLTVTK